MLWKGEDAHMLAIGFKKGMQLHKHKSDIPARIIVIKGEVIYNSEEGGTVALGLYDEFQIPIKEFHWVNALEDSLLVVIKG